MGLIEERRRLIHPTADVSGQAVIGTGTQVWNNAQIREEANIGENCIIGKGVYIDHGVSIGNNVKVQNNVSIYHGVTIEDAVYIGPHACFTNDKKPRAVNENGELKAAGDWDVIATVVKKGASIGANSTILPGLIIGEYAMVGAGSVVTKDIPSYTLAFGNPARERGRVNENGEIV